VRFFADRVRTTNPDAKRDGTKIACVGARTAAAASEAGWEVDFVPSRALTKALADELPGGGRVLVLRSDIADPALPQILRARGFEVDDLIAYTTVVKERQPMEKVDEADLIIFGSPSSVQGLCSLLPGPVMSRAVAKRVACIGPVTARAARAHGFKRIVQPTDAYTFDALLEEVRKANVLE
jgi:uroporphyrinogen-III synthase